MARIVKVPYFEGDEVPLKFKVRIGGDDAELLSARVSVFNDTGEVLHDAPCEIEQDVISYIVPPSATSLASDYRADFSVHFSPDITRTHIIRFHIAQRIPIVPDSELMTLDETSDDYETGGAIAQATRKLRRAGALVVDAARIARDLAENMTGRKL